MNTNPPPMPAPSRPTPQLAPIAAGVLQGLLMSYLIFHAGVTAGLDQNTSVVLAGVGVSILTSVFHRIAQTLHWSM